MSNIQPLIEHLSPDQAHVVVSEAVESNNKKLWIQGVFMQSNVRNHNRRNYPRHEIERAITESNAKIKETNGILGELDHPDNLTLNLHNVSHVITEYRMNGDDVYGKAIILGGVDGTPSGRIAEAVIRAGVRLGVSSRGAGSVNESTGDVSDYNLITCDIVATPSAPNAYPKAVMEAIEYSKSINKIVDLSEAVAHDPAAQDHFKREILKAVHSLAEKGLVTIGKNK